MVSRSNVIPFEIPNLGKIGYDFAQQKKEEQKDRRSEANQKTEGLYGGLTAIPNDFGGKSALQQVYNEVMSYAEQYELDGSDESFKALNESRQKLQAGIKAVSGVLGAYEEEYQKFSMNPSEYETSAGEAAQKRSSLYGKQWGVDELFSRDFMDATVDGLPIKRVKQNKYVDPMTVDDFDGYVNTDFVTVKTTPTSVEVSLNPQAEQDIKQSVLNKSKVNPDFALGVALHYKLQSSPEAFTNGVTQELIAQTVEELETDPKLMDVAASMYTKQVMKRVDQKAKDKYTYERVSRASSTNKPYTGTESERTFKSVVDNTTTVRNGLKIVNGTGLAKLEYKEKVGKLEYQMTPIEIQVNPSTNRVEKIIFVPKGEDEETTKTMTRVVEGEEANNMIISGYGAQWHKVGRETQKTSQAKAENKPSGKRGVYNPETGEIEYN